VLLISGLQIFNAQALYSGKQSERVIVATASEEVTYVPATQYVVSRPSVEVVVTSPALKLVAPGTNQPDNSVPRWPQHRKSRRHHRRSPPRVT
jgi:hypothetical protein